MALIQRHKMYRKVYTGGMVKPLVQVATNLGTALLPSIGKSHIKKLLFGALSAVATTLLSKALEKGSQYMTNTLSNKTNMNLPMNNVVGKILNIVENAQPIALANPIKPIDREVLPIKNQLAAQTANPNVTDGPLRDLQRLGVAGSGVSRVNDPGVSRVNDPGMNKALNKALNKRSDMLLRNLLS